MLVQIVLVFLGIIALIGWLGSLFGRPLRWRLRPPRDHRRLGGAPCPSCGRPRVGAGPCPCGRAT
jgi:hypothetical protein